MAQPLDGSEPLPSDDDAYLALLLTLASGAEVPGVPPLPAFDVQRLFNGGADAADNIRIGFAFYRILRDEAAAAGRPIVRGTRVLDLGCGWGRIARMLLREVDEASIAGIDIDPRGIEACRAAMGRAVFELIGPWGPAPFADASFDLVYACSVFSHLPEDLHLHWLTEIRRVLRPGGLFVSTTLSPAMIRLATELRATGEFRASWQRAVVASFPEGSQAAYDAGAYLFGPMPRGDYGQAIISPGYVQRAWTPLFEVRGYHEARFAQTVIVCRRTA
jgi:ubiquinone/menaquinone biosynthesis C-methylase UbiE